VIGVGNETTGTGIGTETEIESAIRSAGAAGHAAHQEGAAQTQGGQIDGTTDETGMRTGETGIRVTLVAMTETDEIQVGEMERKKNAIDTTGTKGTVNGAEMVSVNHREKALERIPNPERRESRYNYKGNCRPPLLKR
jgi:hypothetical protein